MKHKLSPNAAGTLVALHKKRRLRFFCPETADELIAAGYAYKEQQNLILTAAGGLAGQSVYSKSEKTRD